MFCTDLFEAWCTVAWLNLSGKKFTQEFILINYEYHCLPICEHMECWISSSLQRSNFLDLASLWYLHIAYLFLDDVSLIALIAFCTSSSSILSCLLFGPASGATFVYLLLLLVFQGLLSHSCGFHLRNLTHGPFLYSGSDFGMSIRCCWFFEFLVSFYLFHYYFKSCDKAKPRIFSVFGL